MATIDELKILVTTEVSKAIADLDKTEKQTNKTSASFIKMAAVSAAVGIAVKKMIDVGSQLYEEFAQDELATVRLNAALANAPQITAGAERRFTELASSLQQVSIFGDDVTKSQIAELAALGKSEKEIKKIISAAIDLASATGVDLDTAVKQLNATLQGNAGILGRQNAAVRALSEEELKAGQAIDIVAAQYKGFGEKIGDSAAGATIQFNNAMGDLRETLGGVLAEGIKPLSQGLTEILIKLNDSVVAWKAYQDFVKSGSAAGIDAAAALRTAISEEQVLIANLNEAAPGTKIAERSAKDLAQVRERIKALRESAKYQAMNAGYQKIISESTETTTTAAKSTTKAVQETSEAVEEEVEVVEKVEEVIKSTGFSLEEIRDSWDDIGKAEADALGDAIVMDAVMKEWSDDANGVEFFVRKIAVAFSDSKDEADELNSTMMDMFSGISDAYGSYIDLQENGSDAIIAGMENERDAKLDALEKVRDGYKSGTKEYEAADKKLAQAKIGLDAEIAAKKNEAAEKQFNAQKATSLANIAINTAEGFMKAFTVDPTGILASIILGAGIVQGGTVAAQQYVPFASGGYVDQPTHALIGEAGGEWILNKAQMSGLVKSGIGGGGMTIVQNIGGSVWTSKGLESLAVSAVSKAGRGF